MKRGIWTIPFALAVLLFVSVEPLASRLAAAPQSAQLQEKVQSAQAKPPGMQQPPMQAAQAKPPATPSAPVQAAQAKPDQPAVEQPEDFKAFNEASKTADPQKRIDALHKFMTDWPDSMLVSMASSEISAQLTSSIQQASKSLLSEIDKQVQLSPGSAMLTYSRVASDFLRAGVLLEDAEKLAEKGLASTTEQKFVDDARAARSKPKPTAPLKGTQGGGVSWNMQGPRIVTWTPPRQGPAPTQPRERTDDELRAQFRSQRGQLQNTLAQIYLKRGKSVEAEKTFKEVYANTDVASFNKAVAVRELANFARKAGDNNALQQYLMESVVAGARPNVHDELREIYKKTHNGSLDGLEATLDEMYAKSLPKIDVKPFERPKTKQPRLVLAELFTGAECPPCVGIDLAFHAALERFKPQDLAFLVYHQHIPGPDPMTNPSTEKRLKFYNVRGVPTYYIDGRTDGAGGAGADQAERFLTGRISPAIEKAMTVEPEAKLDLKASMTGSTITVKASAGKIASKSDKLRLHIVLAEERLRYHGGNGIRYHLMVVRSIATAPVKKAAASKESTRAGAAAGDEQGFAIARGRSVKVEYVFDLTKIVADNKKFIDDFLTKPFRGGDKPTFSSRMDDIDPKPLVIVAFVQDEDAKQGSGETIVGGKPTQHEVPLRHILQAVSVRVGAAKKTTN
jgi:hypothetical protein